MKKGDLRGKYVPCVMCGKEVYRNLAELKRQANVYCGRDCFVDSMRKPLPLCEVCGSPVKHHGNRFCGFACSGAYHRALTMTREECPKGHVLYLRTKDGYCWQCRSDYVKERRMRDLEANRKKERIWARQHQQERSQKQSQSVILARAKGRLCDALLDMHYGLTYEEFMERAEEFLGQTEAS